jgi:hypothetical protein
MSGNAIFVCHATQDDAFVGLLREALEAQGLPVWADSRGLSGGDALWPQIAGAIEKARHFLVVVSVHTVNSRWVTKEVKFARQCAKKRTDGFKVIPILLDGITPSALHHWFDNEEPLAVTIRDRVGGMGDALPDLLAALGERLPADRPPQAAPTALPVHDLILDLADLTMAESAGTRRAQARATLTYKPPETRDVRGFRFSFTAPLGPIEAEELAWYLERYSLWPAGVFEERAKRVESQLPEWGRQLFNAVTGSDEARNALEAWKNVAAGAVRRFTVLVDWGDPEKKQVEVNEAAAELLALPWELLRDNRGYLFHGAHGVRVRRRLPNRHAQPVVAVQAPIRVLLVSPRPEEDDAVGYIDHRVSAKPVVEALAQLGELAELTLLTPPTFGALEKELQRAHDAGKPYHVVHFDGHGVYNPKCGLGALRFEDPADLDKLEKRRSQTVDAKRIAEVIRDHRIPLFFLDACQTAKTEKDPAASVAAQLLQEGVASVVGTSHTVLVETTRRFVTVFYRELVQGARVGQAMLAGQRELYGDTWRGKVFGAGDLRLQDWFVPVLFQEEDDPQLIVAVPPAEVQALQRQARKLSLGDLPPEPAHSFVGRSRELSAMERLLADKPYVVIRGEGGEGKTALGVELARWLVATRRFRRAAFVSLEKHGDIRTVMDALPALARFGTALPGMRRVQEPTSTCLSDDVDPR